MSLVGSLEDLGLSDILQIVSLARKSGRLLLRTDGDSGRIVVSDGLVHGAAIKGGPEDLRGLLVGGGELAPDLFDRARDLARARQVGVEEALAEVAELPREQLDRLRREHVEHSVMRMFSWRAGEFSFEVREEPDPEDAELLLATGINTQYLAMEATRRRDEGLLGGTPCIDPAEDEAPVFSGEEPELNPADVTQPVSAAVEALALATARIQGDEDTTLDGFAPEASLQPAGADRARSAQEISSAETVDVETPEATAPEAVAVEVSGSVCDPPPLVAIARNLPALEWLKQSAAEAIPRVHIFLHGETGMDRIRRYLMRGVIPLVVLSPELLDPRDGADGLLARMRALAPEMLVLALLADRDTETPQGFDGSVACPGSLASDPEQWTSHSGLATDLREDLALAAGRAASQAPPRLRASSALESLRAASDRLRDPNRRDDVLSLVLDFAGRELSRVAVFLVRDDLAVGIAQRGMPKAGGPDQDALRKLRFARDELPALFGRALEDRRGARGRVSEAEVARLSELFGPRSPREAYVGPIESGGCVAALVYADNLPIDAPIPDTTALEIVLHEAGMALDRALLERELAEARAGS